MEYWLKQAAAHAPRALAMFAHGRAWTFEDMLLGAQEWAARLWTAGARAGDTIGILLSNRAEYILLIHAVGLVGAALVPLNTRLTAAELAHQVETASLKLLIHSDETAAQAAPFDGRVALLNIDGALPPAGAFAEAAFDLDRVQAIVFTSGTSGRPKGAQLTYANHLWSAIGSSWRLGMLPNDRWLLTLPLYHVGGLAIALRSCLHGTSFELQARFNLDSVSAALDSGRITHVSLVPTMLYRLLQARKQGFPAPLRCILLGGAATSPELIDRCAALNIPISTTYGLTEAASQVATLPPEGVLIKRGSVGKPLPFTQVRIADEAGMSLPNTEYGEIVVRGPTIMRGYLGLSSDRALRDGELFTGDIGYLDQEGDLWLVQRRSDLIVTGGENVYPAEVEAVLRQHPAVAEVCVVGAPDDEWGQVVAAAVVPRAEMHTSAADLTAFCAARLAGYKRPRLIRFVNALPLTASGKIHRQAVRDLFR